MFEMHPDVMALFEKFREDDTQNLVTNPSLEIHAMIVMDAVNDVIIHLDDPGYIIDTILSTGRTHRRFKSDSFSSAAFWVTT